MKRGMIAAAAAAALLLGGCFKKVSYDTEYVLKPLVQTESQGSFVPLEGAVCYAFEVDPEAWTVASYDDAATGVLTSVEDPALKLTPPDAMGEPYDEYEELTGCLAMRISGPAVMIVAVDPVHKLYGFRAQELGENLSPLFVSAVFRPWRQGRSYTDGSWTMVNDFYEEESSGDETEE